MKYKKLSLKSKLRRRYAQYGKSNLHADKQRVAKRVGWRRTRHGRLYFEARKNRSDRNKKRRL